MPTLPQPRCNEPSCHAMSVRNGRCARHQLQGKRLTRRDELHERTYLRTRAEVLAEQPECAHCAAHATQVDHIVPVWAGGSRYDRANLQALCRRCHERKTGIEAVARQRLRARLRAAGIAWETAAPEELITAWGMII